MIEFTTVEKLKVSAVGLLLLAVALLFVHASKQRVISRSSIKSIMISLRFCGVYVVGFLFWCGYLEMPVNLFLILLIVWVVLTSAAAGAGDDLAGFAFGIVLGIPLFILMMFVYWIPILNMFVLEPPKRSDKPLNASSEADELIDQTGVVVATLRPAGNVEIESVQYEAVTEDGSYLDVGNKVQVCGRRNNTLLVRVIK